jgi:hypothetical protein
LIAQLLRGQKSVDRTPNEVVGFLRDFIEETGGEWDWDAFESVPITNPRLDAIRARAVQAGPPDADLEQLRALLSEAERIAQARG